MKNIFVHITLVLSLLACQSESEQASFAPETSLASANSVKGNLFIIGGGHRPDAMMQELVNCWLSEAGDVSSSSSKTKYALVFSQPSGEPDTSYFYIAEQLKQFTPQPVIHVDSLALSQMPLETIQNAALIYITGGDQRRFMEKVGSAQIDAIKQAYKNGATIAGTSAGAALMSAVMITGDQNLVADYEPTYSWLSYQNGLYEKGLGLTDSLIVDQHFIARSRYNRLLSALADTQYPRAAGIEESTALLITPQYATVIGEGQVILFKKPRTFTNFEGRIGFKNMELNAYLPGDTLQLK